MYILYDLHILYRTTCIYSTYFTYSTYRTIRICCTLNRTVPYRTLPYRSVPGRTLLIVAVMQTNILSWTLIHNKFLPKANKAAFLQNPTGMYFIHIAIYLVSYIAEYISQDCLLAGHYLLPIAIAFGSYAYCY